MADYTLSARITGDASGFTKAFEGANETLNKLSDKTMAAGEKVSGFGKNLTMLGGTITAGITTPFIGAVKQTAEFDSAMRKAGAIAGASAKDLDAMTKSALDLGASTSLSSSEVADAMAEMAAKGFDATQTIAAMPGVIAAAEASGEDLALTADTVASALNGFGLEAGDAGRVADILAMAANATAAGVADMSDAFKYAAPGAAKLGISIEELSAATGIMTNAGLKGSQAGTTLRMAIGSLVKPTKAASKTMDKLGFSAIDSKGNFKPLNQIVGELSKSMDGMTAAQQQAALATIFGTEAASGMAILLEQGQEGLKGLTKELENSEGASAAAAAEMKAGIGGALDNLSGAIESGTISIMSQLTPFLTDLALWSTSIVEKFNSMSDGTKKVIAFGIGIVAALGPVLTILGVMTMGIGSLISVVGFLISPIGLVIAALVALAGIFAHQIIVNEKFRSSIISIFQSTVEFIQTFVGQVKTLFESMYDVIFGSMSVKDNADLLANMGFDPAIASRLMSITSKIGGIITSFWDIWFGSMSVKDNVDFMQMLGISEDTATKVGEIASNVQTVVTTAGNMISSFFQALGPVIMGALGNIGPQIVSVFQTVWGIVQAIIPIFTTFFSSLISGFQSAGGVGSGFAINLTTVLFGLNPVIKGIILLFQNFGPQIVEAFQQVATMIIPVVGTIGAAIGQLASTVIPIFTQSLATLIPIVVQMGITFMTIIQSVLPVVISLFNQFVPIIIQVVMIIAQIIAQVVPLAGVLISALLPSIQNIIEAFMNIVQTVAPAFIAIIKAIMAIVEALLPVFMSIVTVVVHVVAAVISAIGPIVSFIAGVINAIMAIIAPIVAFVAGIIASIVSTITPIIVIVTGVFNTVFTVVSGVFRNIMTFIGTAINSIGKIISGLSSIVSGVFNTISGIVTGVMSGVSRTITGVFSSIQNAWSGLTGFVNGVFNGISGAVSQLVGQVKGFINGVIGGINSAVSLINKLPGVSISAIPYLARGTDDFAGGFARINEGGRGELVNLPNGAQVIPHDVSMRYAREAGKANSQAGSGKVFSQSATSRDSEIVSLLTAILHKEQGVYLDGEPVGRVTNTHLGNLTKRHIYTQGGRI